MGSVIAVVVRISVLFGRVFTEKTVGTAGGKRTVRRKKLTEPAIKYKISIDMEILTPQIIWKGYDASVLPLNVSIVSSCKNGDTEVIDAYFNGSTVTDGVVRVSARCFLPSVRGKLPAVVYMPDVSRNTESAEEMCARLAEQGFIAVMPDYAGVRDDTYRFTLYPESLSCANFTPECLTDYPEDVRFNCWTVWAEIAMRAITFACSLDGADPNRVALIGEGVASSAAIMTAAIDGRPKCAVSLFSAGREMASATDESELKYKVALADAAYAPMIKLPLLMMVASNEEDGSVDEMCDVFSLIPPETGSRLTISERAVHSIGIKQRDNIRLWLKKYLLSDVEVPQTPVLSAKGSEGKLYYSVKADRLCETELFVSQNMQRGELRNWRKAELVSVGENEYIAHVDVYNIKEKIYAFANVRLPEGISVSSPIYEKLPASLGILPAGTEATRLLYDGDVGTDDWTDPAAGEQETPIFVAEGPFGISGVCGSSLATFKLGDPAFRGKDGYLLQMMIYSAKAQSVTLTVTATNGEGDYAEYSFTAELSPEDVWRKLTLESEMFKSPYGVCENWADVVCLRINGESPVIISGMLWV